MQSKLGKLKDKQEKRNESVAHSCVEAVRTVQEKFARIAVVELLRIADVAAVEELHRTAAELELVPELVAAFVHIGLMERLFEWPVDTRFAQPFDAALESTPSETFEALHSCMQLCSWVRHVSLSYPSRS